MDTEIVDSIDPGLLAQSHKVATLVEVLENEVVIDTGIRSVTGGSITLDGAAATRSSVDLTIVDDGISDYIPTSEEAKLAPYGNEVRVSRGIYLPDKIQLVRLGVFQIERAPVGNDGTQVQISGPDRSGRFIDASFEEPGQIPSGTNATQAILDTLLPAWPDMPYNFIDVGVGLPHLTYGEGEDRWDFARGIAQAVGGELYFDRNGEAALTMIPSILQSHVATFAEGEEGVLLSADREWDRGTIYNRFIVTGENPDVNGAPPRAEVTDNNPNSPTYYGGKFGKKPFFYSNNFIADTTQAYEAAQGLLARALGAPDSVSFSSLVDPSRNPSDIVRITREKIGVNEDHILDQIVIPLEASGVMTGQTRVARELVA